MIGGGSWGWSNLLLTVPGSAVQIVVDKGRVLEPFTLDISGCVGGRGAP